MDYKANSPTANISFYFFWANVNRNLFLLWCIASKCTSINLKNEPWTRHPSVWRKQLSSISGHFFYGNVTSHLWFVTQKLCSTRHVTLCQVAQHVPAKWDEIASNEGTWCLSENTIVKTCKHICWREGNT